MSPAAGLQALPLYRQTSAHARAVKDTRLASLPEGVTLRQPGSGEQANDDHDTCANESLGAAEARRAAGDRENLRCDVRRTGYSVCAAEDVSTIHCNGMDWDVGSMVYAPNDPSRVRVGLDGKKIGIFMTHGGASDWRSIEPLAKTFCGKRGYKVCAMTYPGRFYFDDKNHDWPGDTFHADGTVRTPIWQRGEAITADQYEIHADADHREISGTRRYAVAKPGAQFYLRTAAWP